MPATHTVTAATIGSPKNGVATPNASPPAPSMAPDTPDGFYTDYDPIIEYEVCDLIPGTSDGFPEYNIDPIYWDSS